MSLCIKYGCDYQLDLDGQVTCTLCGAMDDDKHVTTHEKYNLSENPSDPTTNNSPVTKTETSPEPTISLKSFENQVDFE
jgi:hypothetical protein